MQCHIQEIESPESPVYWKCIREFHPFVPPVQTFTATTCYAASTELNHIHFFSILNVVANPTQTVFPGTATLWNQLPRVCFLDHSLSIHFIQQSSRLTNFSYIHKVHLIHNCYFYSNLYLEWLPSLVLYDTWWWQDKCNRNNLNDAQKSSVMVLLLITCRFGS